MCVRVLLLQLPSPTCRAPPPRRTARLRRHSAAGRRAGRELPHWWLKPPRERSFPPSSGYEPARAHLCLESGGSIRAPIDRILPAMAMDDAVVIPIPSDDDDDNLGDDRGSFSRYSRIPVVSDSPAVRAPSDGRGEASRPAGRVAQPPPGTPTSFQTARPHTARPHAQAQHDATDDSRPDVNTFLMCRMGESLAEVARELSEMRSGSSGGSKQSLPALPRGEGSRPLPSIKAWRSWQQTKLAGWCGLQADGFAEAVRDVLAHPRLALCRVHNDARFAKANQALAFELMWHDWLCLVSWRRI